MRIFKQLRRVRVGRGVAITPKRYLLYRSKKMATIRTKYLYNFCGEPDTHHVFGFCAQFALHMRTS